MFKRAFDELACDVIALQECASDEATRSVAAAIAFDAVVFPSPCRWPAAVLSRYPLDDTRSLAPLSADNADPLSRAAGIAHFMRPDGRRVCVVVVHLHPAGPEIRRLEAARLLPEIEAAVRGAEDVIVLGDFNSARHEAMHEALRALGFVNALEACGAGACATRHFVPDKEQCVDHIYLGEGLASLVDTAWVAHWPPFAVDSSNHKSRACSDHFPVVVEIGTGRGKQREGNTD